MQSELTENLNFFNNSVQELIKTFKLQKLDSQCVTISDTTNAIAFKENYDRSNLNIKLVNNTFKMVIGQDQTSMSKENLVFSND